MSAGSASRPVESYWVLPGRFLAGEYPCRPPSPDASARLDFLLSNGIDTFFDLTEPDELPPYLPLLEERAAVQGLRISHQRFPMVDFGVPERSTMLAALDNIDAVLAAHRRLYLHCRGGIGRTGMTVGCYLVRHGHTGGDALRQIEQFWRSEPGRRYYPLSPETPEQARFILAWRELDTDSRR